MHQRIKQYRGKKKTTVFFFKGWAWWMEGVAGFLCSSNNSPFFPTPTPPKLQTGYIVVDTLMTRKGNTNLVILGTNNQNSSIPRARADLSVMTFILTAALPW